MHGRRSVGGQNCGFTFTFTDLHFLLLFEVDGTPCVLSPTFSG